MSTPAQFRVCLTETALEAADFDGDEVELAARARDRDRAAVAKLIRAYAAVVVLTALRLRPAWLPPPDAAQEAMIVLQRLIEAGSTTIALELPSAIQATFEALNGGSDSA